MPDKKLTDNEIVKALECCIKPTSDCENCPLYIMGDGDCVDKSKQGALDLINRLQAENERLKPFEDKIAEFKSHVRVEDMLVFASSLEEWLEFCDNLKAEAYKEFADKVKANKRKLFNYIYSSTGFDNQIDNLLKEMGCE